VVATFLLVVVAWWSVPVQAPNELIGLIGPAGVAMAGQAPLAAQPTNFSGVWVLEGFFGSGPLGFRNFRSVCELPGDKASIAAESVADVSGPADSPGHLQLQSIGNVEGELRIDQSPTQVTVERKYSGSLGGGTHKDVFMLDGSESVTTAGVVKSSTRSRWEGPNLVVDHRLQWTVDNKEVGCNVRETFSLTDRNTLSLLATNNERDVAQTANQTYVRKR